MKIKIKDTHKYAFFSAIILGMLLHFTLYSQQITTTDGFLYGTRYIAGEWEISLGRWFIVILNKLRFGLISPAYITFFAIFVLGISSILIIDIFEIKKKLSSVLISATIVVAPFVYQTLLYEFTADAYFIAWLLAILAVFLYKRKKIILSVISIVLMMGIYQSYINVVMFLGIAIAIVNLAENKWNIGETIKKLLFYYIMCCIGILLYYITTQIVLKATGIKLSSYGGASENSFCNILKNIPNGLKRAYLGTYYYYFGDVILNNSTYCRYIYFAIMYILLILNIFLQKNKRNILIILYFLVLSPIVLAFSELIILQVSIQILMSATFICPILLVIKFIDMNDKNKLLKYAEIVVVFIILYTYAIMGEATYISLKQNYEQVYTKLSRVVERVIVSIFFGEIFIKNFSQSNFMFNKLIKLPHYLIFF